VIEATIDEEGKVADARVVKSVPLLDQAALDAVRQWEYQPSLLNGVPTAVVTTVTIKFTRP
jgi:protein TonB